MKKIGELNLLTGTTWNRIFQEHLTQCQEGIFTAKICQVFLSAPSGENKAE